MIRITAHEYSEKENWEHLGYSNHDGDGYKCNRCGEIFSGYNVKNWNDPRCPKCGCQKTILEEI